ncbi:MAG: phosphatidate cytidylyltransferase [Bacillota bacterium]
MKQRIITGLILAVVLIPLLFVPKIVFYSVIALFSLLAVRELVNMVSEPGNRFIGYFYTGLFTLAFYATILLSYLGMLASVYVLAVMMVALISGTLLVISGKFNYETLTRYFLSIVYVAIPFFALSMIRHTGLNMLFYLLMLAMLTDIFAYFVGMRFGKTKLAPTISPKKTVEGFIGGTVIAAVVATVFAYFAELFPLGSLMEYGFVFLAGWLVAMSAQGGDLFASSMKRFYGIKDFSNLLPGHGGILDRLDSTMFAGTVLALVLLMVGGV